MFNWQAEKLMLLYEETKRMKNKNMHPFSGNSSQNSHPHDQNLFDPPNEEHGSQEFGIVVSNQVPKEENDQEDPNNMEAVNNTHQLYTGCQGQNSTYVDYSTNLEAAGIKTFNVSRAITGNKLKVQPNVPFLSNNLASPIFEQFKSFRVENGDGCRHVWVGIDPPSACKRHVLNQAEREFQSKRSRILVAF